MKDRSIRRAIALSGIIMFAVFGAYFGLAEEAIAPEDTMTMRGIVGSVDCVGSLLVVDAVQFLVTDKTKAYKGNSKIWFSEINVGDPVVVDYYKDDKGVLKAVRITVEYSGNLPV